MGLCCPKTLNQTVILLGLDNAGKSSILHRLANEDALTQASPTIGHNKAILEKQGINFEFWDVGGQENIRGIWAHYLKSAHAIIFVIDSADQNRIDGKQGEDSALEELKNVLNNPDLKFTAPLLVFANKQDKIDALSHKDIERRLQLSQNCQTRPYLVSKCCAVNTQDAGIDEGITWLCEALKNAKRPK